MIKLNLNKKLTKAQNGTVIPVVKHQNMFYNPDGSGGQVSGTNAYSAPSPGSGGFAEEKTRNETTRDYVLRTIEAEKVDAQNQRDAERQQEVDFANMPRYNYNMKYGFDKKSLDGYAPGTPGHTFRLYGEDITTYQYGFDTAEDNIALANKLRDIYTNYRGSERTEKLQDLRDAQYQKYLSHPARLAALKQENAYNEGLQSRIDLDFGPGVDNARADVRYYQPLFNPALHQEQKTAPKVVDPSYQTAHFTLGMYGMIPVFGEPFNLADAALYHYEGDNFNRNLSLASTLPFLGNATGAFQMGKNAVNRIANYSRNQRIFNNIRKTTRNRAIQNKIISDAGGDLQVLNKKPKYTNVYDIKRGDDPINNLVHDVFDEAVEKELKHLDSPIVRERLRNQGYTDDLIDAFIAEKKQVLSSNVNIKNIEDVPGSDKVTAGVMLSGSNEMGVNLNHIVNKAEGNPAAIKTHLEKVINHELAHMGTYMDEALSIQDDLIRSSITKTQPSDMRQMDWDYLTEPDEIYARIRGIQDDIVKLSDDAAQSNSSSVLDTQPIGGEDFIDYGRNSSTQNLIDYNTPGGALNKETFDQIKDKLPARTTDDLEDLREVMGDDEILNLINSIVENDAPIQEEMFYAEQGGKIPVRKHQEFDEFGGVFLDPNIPLSQQTKTRSEEEQKRVDLNVAGAKQYALEKKLAEEEQARLDLLNSIPEEDYIQQAMPTNTFEPGIALIDNTGRPGEIARFNMSMRVMQQQRAVNKALATDGGWERADDAEARRREEQGEGNANTIINYYAAYYSGNPADDDKTHVVKSGENLSRIAQNYGLETTAVISANPQIKNPSLIRVGQPVTIPGTNPKVFAVADKNTGRMHIYNIADVKAGNLNPYMSMPMLVGARSGTDPLADAQTVTKYYPGGRRVDWSLGNDATGAGTYYVSRANKKSKYRPSSLERRATGASGSSPSFNLKNESGIEVATTIHGTPNVDISLIDNGPLVYDLTRVEALLEGPAFQAAREEYNATKGPDDPPFESIAFRGSNGCINGLCDDLNTLYDDPDFTVGTPIHILPDNSENFYEIVDGNLVFRASREQRELANEEYQPDDFLEDIDPNYKATAPKQTGQGINISRNTISYEPAKIVFDKNALGRSGLIDNRYPIGNAATRTNQWEYQNRAVPFMTAISDNKKRILDVLVKNGSGITSDEYNSIIPITVGIFGVESGFGNETSNFEDAFKAQNKLRKGSEASVSNADVTGEYAYLTAAGKDLRNHSVGWTQINWNTALTKKEKEILADLGIYGPQDFIDPEKSAIATQAILGHRLNARPGNNTFEKLTKSFNNNPNYPDRVAAFAEFVDVYVPANNAYYTQMNETGTTTYSPEFLTLGDYYDPYALEDFNLLSDDPVDYGIEYLKRGVIDGLNSLGSGAVDLIGGPEGLVNTYEGNFLEYQSKRAGKMYHNTKSKIESLFDNLFEEGGKVPVKKHQDNEMNPNLIYDDNVGYIRTIGGRRIPVNLDIMGAEQRQNYRNYKNYIDYLNQQAGGAEIKTGDDYRKAYRQQQERLYQGGGIKDTESRSARIEDDYDPNLYDLKTETIKVYEEPTIDPYNQTVYKKDAIEGREAVEAVEAVEARPFKHIEWYTIGELSDASLEDIDEFIDKHKDLLSTNPEALGFSTKRPASSKKMWPSPETLMDKYPGSYVIYNCAGGSCDGNIPAVNAILMMPEIEGVEGRDAVEAIEAEPAKWYVTTKTPVLKEGKTVPKDVPVESVTETEPVVEPKTKFNYPEGTVRYEIRGTGIPGEKFTKSTVFESSPIENDITKSIKNLSPAAIEGTVVNFFDANGRLLLTQPTSFFYRDGGSRIKLDINKRLGINVDKLPPIPIGSRGLKKYAKKNPLAVAALGKNPFRVAGSPPKDLLR